MLKRKPKTKDKISVVTGSRGIRLIGQLGYLNLDSITLTPKEALRVGLLLIDAARMTSGGIVNLLDEKVQP